MAIEYLHRFTLNSVLAKHSTEIRVTPISLGLTNLWPSDSGLNWNLEMLVFEERRKPEYPEKNLSEQGREPTTNSTHIMTPGLGVEPGPHWWEASTLTTAPSALAPALLR